MKWYLSFDACIRLTQWYLERAGVRGGGGELFTSDGIRAAWYHSVIFSQSARHHSIT